MKTRDDVHFDMNAGYFEKYALHHGVSTADAIADRNYPMSKADCLEIFEEIEGREATEEEIEIMEPDHESTIEQFWHNARYGYDE